MAKITVSGWQCERCEHIWVPAQIGDETPPNVCPRCKSPYWNKPRQRPKPEGKKKSEKE